MSRQLDVIAAGLHDAGALKVWSLIITLFGDSIVDRGGNVSATTVRSVLGRVEIGSGAIRTAFSRLASDGWIVREKQGRQSYYQLTDDGKSPFAMASKRIYSPVSEVSAAGSNWLFAMHQDKSSLVNLPIDNAVLLPNRSLLIENPAETERQVLQDRGFLTVVGQCGDIPGWLVEHLIDAECGNEFDTLQTTFKKLSARPPSDPLSALVARTLLIHQWRRLLLRYPALPPELKGDTLAAENNCRQFVAQLYHRLTASAEQWLSEQGRCLSGDLPEPLSNPLDRFTHRYLKDT